MKKKRNLIILIGVIAIICFWGASVFFALQGFTAAKKKHAYFDVYKAQAEEYINTAPEILEKYGDRISIKFDKTVTYSENRDRGFFDRYIEVFSPQVPDTLEEFSENMDRIKFKVWINNDAYEIVFEKNDSGELIVSSFTSL